MSLSATTDGDATRRGPSKMMFVSIGLGTAIALVLITVVSFLTGGGSTSTAKSQNALVGTSIKTFTLAGLNGGVQRAPWSEHRASVLIFFASWCGPCQREMPKVASYVSSHGSGNVEVLGIDANDERSAAQNFVRRDHVTFPIAFDAEGTVTSGNFSFETLPETVFLNNNGVVTNVYIGAIPTRQLASGLHRLERS